MRQSFIYAGLMKTKTATETATILGISRQAIHEAIKRGALKARKQQIGGYRIHMISPAEIRRYRAQNLGKYGRKLIVK